MNNNKAGAADQNSTQKTKEYTAELRIGNCIPLAYQGLTMIEGNFDSTEDTNPTHICSKKTNDTNNTITPLYPAQNFW